MFAHHKAKDIERAVQDAFAGRWPGQAPGQAGQPLFTLRTDPKSKRQHWLPTAVCDRKTYEGVRKALGGMHLIENGLWCARHLDYLHQVYSWFDSSL